MTLRQTYGFLDYCGDIGGLIDGLHYLIALILSPIWKLKYSNFMLTRLFKSRPGRQLSTNLQSSQRRTNWLNEAKIKGSKAEDEKEKLSNELKEEFKSLKSIKSVPVLSYFVCCRKKDIKQYRSKLEQAQK